MFIDISHFIINVVLGEAGRLVVDDFCEEMELKVFEFQLAFELLQGYPPLRMEYFFS